MRVLRLELSKHEWLYGVTTKLLPQARTPKPETSLGQTNEKQPLVMDRQS